MNILAPTVNTELWNMLFTTRPSVVKEVTGKGFACSSAHPYWITSRLTEVFGANGFGWGIEVKDQGFERIDEENTHHWALVELWYIKDGKRCASQHMGGTKAKYKTKHGSSYDEDAPKKSVTDAFVKCASMLGLAGDIHSGLWNSNGYKSGAMKYWAEVDKQQFEQHNQYANAEWIDTESKFADDQTSGQQQQQQQQQSINTIDSILNQISKAESKVVTTNIFKRYKDTNHAQIIKQACIDKCIKEGWEVKKSQQQPA